MMKKILLACFMFCSAFMSTKAQDQIEANVNTTIVSSYLWRGSKLDNAAIQPTIELNYKGLVFSAFGSYGLNSNDITKEFDLTLGYKFKNFNVSVTDYFCTQGDDKYFFYESSNTAHTFEANIGYDFGICSLQWFTNFAGLDGYDKKGKRCYTSYFQIDAPFQFGGLNWTASVGGVPYKANNNFYTANSKDFAITNVEIRATKEIKISDHFSLPVFTDIACNPSAQSAYFVIGITLVP